MTLTEPTAAPAVGPPAPRRSPRRAAVAALIGLVVVAVGVVTFIHSKDAAALGSVHVFLDSRSLSCEDAADVTSVTTGAFEEDGSDAYRVPAVRAHPGLDCRLSVVLRNDSDRDIDVDRIVFPMIGPRNGTGLHADFLAQQGLEPYGAKDALDATFDYVRDPENRTPYVVTAFSVQRFAVHLSWSDGCMQKGSSSTFIGAPVFSLATGLARMDRGGEGPGYAVIGTDDSVAAVCS